MYRTYVEPPDEPPKGAYMKGQISLEYLVLSIVALAMLSVSLFALLNIRDYSSKASDIYRLKTSASSLGAAINELCALGSGNGRSVLLSTAISVEYADGVVAFSSSNSSKIVQASRCQVEVMEKLEGEVFIENENGLIKFTKR